MEPEELTELALEAAVAAGAGYADVRWVREETEGLTVTDDRVDDLEAEDSSGLGVRVLVDGRWGFAASAVLDPARARDLAGRAVEVARASAAAGGEPVRLAPAEPAVASWSTPVARDPFAVPLAERVELLLAACDAQRSVAGLAHAKATVDLWRRRTVLWSTEGTRRRPDGDPDRGRHRGGRGRRRRPPAAQLAELVPGPVPGRRLGGGRGRRPGRQRPPGGRRGGPAPGRAGAARAGDHGDPGRPAALAPGPRVGRAPAGAGPDPGHGGRLRRAPRSWAPTTWGGSATARRPCRSRPTRPPRAGWAPSPSTTRGSPPSGRRWSPRAWSPAS